MKHQIDFNKKLFIDRLKQRVTATDHINRDTVSEQFLVDV